MKDEWTLSIKMGFGKISKKRVIAVVMAVGLALAGLGVYSFFNVGKWLVLSDSLPEKADLIFVFAGDKSRAVYAFELMEKYPEATLLCAKQDANLIKKRYPKAASNFNIQISPDCKSTIEEVRLLRGYVEGIGKDLNQTTLLVSSPFHMRRISIMTNIVMRGGLRKQKSFFYIPVNSEHHLNKRESYVTWWDNRGTKAVVKLELTKIIYYFFVVINPFLDENSIKEHYQSK